MAIPSKKNLKRKKLSRLSASIQNDVIGIWFSLPMNLEDFLAYLAGFLLVEAGLNCRPSRSGDCVCSDDLVCETGTAAHTIAHVIVTISP